MFSNVDMFPFHQYNFSKFGRNGIKQNPPLGNFIDEHPITKKLLDIKW